MVFKLCCCSCSEATHTPIVKEQAFSFGVQRCHWAHVTFNWTSPDKWDRVLLKRCLNPSLKDGPWLRP